ncbi:hypothetical protein [Sphaerisporangium sp. TRM90804]|uniref:hypothetical protein n=1 Tax=Sphaerisporangium sp. TRM90804 TaxID=3031113 RepID=UPI00244D6D3E|nr:hypothetical protein [Sphaerisporangium sp. TRM90804]MDH2429226.1 hypothetical protein [Sphaerisporangium sp. TRM90804]
MAAVHWDPFEAIERDVRAMVADSRWAGVPDATQVQAMTARVLRAQDDSCWLFGRHARWHRHDRSDGRWHLSAPPLDPRVRASALPAHPAPVIPVELLPAASDLEFDRGSTQGFVGPDVPGPITEGLRLLLGARRGLREEPPFVVGPLSGTFFADVPATVATVWGTVMWCAYAPAFDGNEVLLSMFGEFLARPLPGDEWVRWLPPVPLEALVAPYAERLARGAQGAALGLAGLMAETARLLASDPRFAPRATALLAMVEPLRARPWLDHSARDAEKVRAAWLARCPAGLRGALLAETAPERHFQHCLYDMVRALGFVTAQGGDPRATAASLLAADVDAVAPDVAPQLYPLLDAELRRKYIVALSEPGHALRDCWPRDGEPSAVLRPPDRASAAALLGAAYATGLAWCRLTATEPPERGFPASAATVSCLIAHRDDPLPAPAASGDPSRR